MCSTLYSKPKGITTAIHCLIDPCNWECVYCEVKTEFYKYFPEICALQFWKSSRCTGEIGATLMHENDKLVNLILQILATLLSRIFFVIPPSTSI
jgi:hypothetical protein